jgi:MFS family permease
VQEKVTWKTLPHKKQLLLLALCRLSTPLSNACLLPYLYYLIKSILSNPDHPSAPQQISRLTGLLVAAYPLGQMSTSMIWGQVSDKYGRKATILAGLALSAIANFSFGFSRSIGMLLIWRVLAGMANGTVGVMRTMTAEIVKERRYHTRAFLAPPLIFNSGRVVALAIGGCLADPVQNLPSLFGPSGLFNVSHDPNGVRWAARYPYALPAIFNGTVLTICLMLAALWLKETLLSTEKSWNLGLAVKRSFVRLMNGKTLRRNAGEYAPVHTEEAEVLMADASTAQSPSGAPPYPTKAHRPRVWDIWTKQLWKTLIAFGLLPLHNSTFLHVFPVFLSMPVVIDQHPAIFQFTGGLGLAPPTVGLYLATFGTCGILLQLFIYPHIQKHIGTLGALRLTNCIFPLAYLSAPYLALLPERSTARWLAMAAVLFTQVMARTMAIPSSVVLLTEAAPKRSVLGTVHGAGSTLSAAASASGPVIGGLLLSKGIDIGVIGLVWWGWLCTVALLGLIWSFVLKEDTKVEGDAMETA